MTNHGLISHYFTPSTPHGRYAEARVLCGRGAAAGILHMSLILPDFHGKISEDDLRPAYIDSDGAGLSRCRPDGLADLLRPHIRPDMP